MTTAASVRSPSWSTPERRAVSRGSAGSGATSMCSSRYLASGCGVNCGGAVSSLVANGPVVFPCMQREIHAVRWRQPVRPEVMPILEWHLRQALAPLLFDDHNRVAAEAGGASPLGGQGPALRGRQAQGHDP